MIALSASSRWTNNLVYGGNHSLTGGLGVLTRHGASSSSAANWNGATDALARVGAETNNVIRRAAYGRVNGPSTVKATLDGVPVGTTFLGTNAGQWRASLDLAPGAHQLSVTAHHTSGQFSTNAASWFTNSAATDRAINAFDAVGQLTRKVWLSSSGTSNRTQDLYWDAKGRLWKVVERDSGLKVARAWAAKEVFTKLWTYRYEGAARRFFKQWFGWVSRSRLKPLVKVARMIKSHLENILTYLWHPITNAVTEGLNSKIQMIKSNSRGFRSFDNYRIRILFFYGKLNLYPL